MHIEPWQMVPNHPNGYTISEAEYIYQRKAPCDAPMQTIRSICEKSDEFQDHEIYEFFSEVCHIREQWQAEKNKKSIRESSQRHQEKIKKYGDNYTPRQLQIITGEIAYEAFSGLEVSTILKAAKRKQDAPVVDLMESLLRDKRADNREKRLQITRDATASLIEIANSTSEAVRFTKKEALILFGLPEKKTLTTSRFFTIYHKALLTKDPGLIDKAQFILQLYGLAEPLPPDGLNCDDYLFSSVEEIATTLEKHSIFPIKLSKFFFKKLPK